MQQKRFTDRGLFKTAQKMIVSLLKRVYSCSSVVLGARLVVDEASQHAAFLAVDEGL